MTDDPRTPAGGRALAVPSGRLARLARLGSTGAGVAGRAAAAGALSLGRGRRPVMRDLLLTPGNVARVTEELARMRGAAMKLGQLVSMDAGGLLPPEFAAIMDRLRDGAHVMPPAQLRRALDAAWGPGWLGAFERFDVHPIAAASIGQVHRARLRDGRDVAVKVQYPGIAESIASDVANVGVLVRMSGLLPPGFALGPYLDEARAQLHAEADYEAEAGHLARFGAILAGDRRFAVPALHADWSTRTVLTMSHVAGRPVETAADAPQAVRDGIAADLVALTLRELFEWGWMQTDPNFANYRWDEASDRIALLDFGATRPVAPWAADLHRRVMRAALDGDRDAMRALAVETGTIGPATAPHHAERIVGMADMALAELRRADPFDFGATDLPRRLRDEGVALARDGFVPSPPPVELLHVQRKIAGMALLAMRLRARVPVRAMVERALAATPAPAA